MAYRPPYDSIDDLNVRNSLEVDIAYNTDERAGVLERVEEMKVRQQRYLENGDTFTANNVQKKIDSQTAYAARLQEQIDGSRADLAIVDQRQRPTQTDTAQNELENNPPSDNNPEAETLPLEEEAAIEETVLEEGDEGEVVDDPEPLSEEDAVDPETGADVVNDSSSNEELATTNEDGVPVEGKPEADQQPEEVYIEYPNVLHDYPSYTYGLSLHLLTGDDWNDLATTGNYQPKNVLIASAGKFDQTLGPNKLLRNKYFNDDFYFEDFDMTTVIGATDKNPSTNAINLNFNIIEPYGVTLLNRIIDATKELEASEKTTNYLENPYLMQIDFYAQSADGTALNPIPGITKYIPIKIVGFDFSIDTEGAKYSIQAIPFNHSAFDMTTQETPITMEIDAGTVQDFFSAQNDESDTFEKASTRFENEREKYQETLRSGESIQNVSSVLLSNAQIAPVSQIFKVKGYASAYNAYYEDIKKNKETQYNDTIRFKFDDEIAKAKIVEVQKISTKDNPMGEPAEQRRDYITIPGDASNALYLNKSIRKYAINRGTSIEAVLDDVITNSTYVLDQIWDPSDYTDPKKFADARLSKKDVPFKWFKVVPEIKLEKFDKVTMRWTRTITYNVVSYTVRNNKLDTMPGGKAQIPLKVYKYIYTGENNDILDFDIKFNAAYYTSVTTYPSKLTKTENLLKSIDEKDAKVEGAQNNTPNTIQPNRIIPQILDSQKTATGGGITSKQMMAQDATKSILTAAAGDMINVYLTIIGDPLFIKQDDIFYQQSVQKTKFKNNKITPNGSFITDTGELYVQLEFKTPVDRDQDTGGIRYEERYQNSLFNGMYKVITVDSKFSKGQFIQVLNLVRQWNQDRFDYTVTKKENSKQERAESEDGYDPTNDAENISTTNDTANLDVASETVQDEVAADSAPQDDQIEEDAGDTEARKETDILSQINDQEATPMGTQNEPDVNSPEGLLAAEDEWVDKNLENQAKQDAVTAQLREANREYRTATQAYNIYGAAAFNQDPTLRGRLEKAVEDRQKLTAELNQLEQEKTALDANKPF